MSYPIKHLTTFLKSFSSCQNEWRQSSYGLQSHTDEQTTDQKLALLERVGAEASS